MTEFLDLEDLVLLARRLGVGPVRDAGLLEAACARPRTSVFGVDAYPSTEGKAAALLHSLVRGDPLVDGNKRLGWLAAVVFLDINGVALRMPDDDAFDLVMRVAEGTIDLAGIAEALAGSEQALAGSEQALAGIEQALAGSAEALAGSGTGSAAAAVDQAPEVAGATDSREGPGGMTAP